MIDGLCYFALMIAGLGYYSASQTLAMAFLRRLLPWQAELFAVMSAIVLCALTSYLFAVAGVN